MRSRFLVALVVAAACGDDAATTPDSGSPDAPPDASACAPPHVTDPDPIVEMVEALRVQYHVPGVAFAVLDHGVVTHQGALGVRELGACEAFTSKTRVRMGPALRVLDALAILAEKDAGKLTLDTTVKSLIPGFGVTNGDASGVTIRQLLDESAGLYVADFRETCPSQHLAEYWSAPHAALEFAPGEAVGNWDEELSLEGAVLEAVEPGKTYRDVMRDRVFAPLGMTATFDHEELLAGDHGRGTSLDGATPVLYDPEPCAAWEPTEQLYLSLDDGIALARYLSTGQPSLIADLPLVYDAGAADFYPEFGHGYGIRSFNYDGAGMHRLYFVDGTFDGTGVELDFFDDGYALVFVENAQRFTPDFTDRIIHETTGHGYESPYVPLPVSAWSAYEGTWHSDIGNRTFDTQLVDGELVGTYQGIDVTFAPIGEDTFSVSMLGHSANVRFFGRDETGHAKIVVGDFASLGAAFHRQPQ